MTISQCPVCTHRLEHRATRCPGCGKDVARPSDWFSSPPDIHAQETDYQSLIFADTQEYLFQLIKVFALDRISIDRTTLAPRPVFKFRCGGTMTGEFWAKVEAMNPNGEQS